MKAGRAGAPWNETRRRLAGLAVLGAAMTGGATATLGGPHLLSGAVGYVGFTVAGLFAPVAITVQVVTGLLLVGGILLEPNGPGPLALVPLIAGVVATAELLGGVARSENVPGLPLVHHLRRAGLAVIVTGTVFVVVALVGEAPGPGGLPATALASGACVAVAMLLARGARAGRTSPPLDNQATGR